MKKMKNRPIPTPITNIEMTIGTTTAEGDCQNSTSIKLWK
jgi:hypothetical protein